MTFFKVGEMVGGKVWTMAQAPPWVRPWWCNYKK